jgi:feruloyl-CoA synthase
MILFHGGSYYIDGGRPVPGLFDQTLRNLRDIAPTVYFNVPAGFGALLPHLEQDKAFREHFFKDLMFTWYAGAALTQDLWDRYERVAYQATGERIVMTSGFGTTESAPSQTFAHWPDSRLGNVGVPLPGVELKLAPVGEKMEIRAKGPCISPGYYKEPELTAASRDEDGFYMFGDAMKLIDPDDPEKGMLFDGRLSENFKLSTGTWVSVGTLRTDVIATAAPVFQDLIVCGHDRDYLGVLAWPEIAGCRNVSGLGADADVRTLIGDPKVGAHVAKTLSAFNKIAGASSRRIKRVILMAEPAQIDADEITDKGYINQRAARERRADLVHELYTDPPSDRVIEID